MHSYEVKTKFEEGDRVGCDKTKRIGTVTRVWIKCVQVNTKLFNFFISYTVQPDVASYNSFKILEENTREVVSSAEDGKDILLPLNYES